MDWKCFKMSAISYYEKIPDRYMVICDTDIMFCGSKKDCITYYNSLPNPMRMTIIRIAWSKELRRK